MGKALRTSTLSQFWYLVAIVLSVPGFIASDYLPLVSCGHCIVCPSIYSFWLTLWYLQTFLRLCQIKVLKPGMKLAMHWSSVKLFQIKLTKPDTKLAMHCSTVRLFQTKLAIWNIQWIAYKIVPDQTTQACNEIRKVLLIRQTDPVKNPKPGMEIAMDCSWDSIFLIKLTKA